MNQPHEGNTLPPIGGQTKILFVNEGNPLALFHENRGGKRRQSCLKFSTVEAALAWCRQTATVLVYCPANVSLN